MKLYRHYKNKPYKYIGTAKHSETLDEVVIYDCLYDNPGGRTWVRPKDMFFSSVDVGGRTMPRFAPVDCRIETFEEVGEKQIIEIGRLMESAFGGKWDLDYFNETYRNHRRFHLVIAYVDDKAVGFKIGYEENKWFFYSWLGGVHPEFRGLGIAKLLMQKQHEWCRAQGYKKVSTKTMNQFKEMLILNLNAGFQITGTNYSKERGGLKISMELQLS